MTEPESGKIRAPAPDESPEPGRETELRGHLIRALADTQSALAGRLDALERAIQSSRGDRLEESDAARLSKLQEAVTDLAAAQLDARRQLDALAGAVEHLGDRGLDGESAAPKGDHPRPATFIPSPSARGWRARLKRRARVVLRSTLGKLRQVWDATHPRPPWGDVRLMVKGRPRRRPSLTVVIRAGGDAGAIEALLEGQTDGDFTRLTRPDDGPGEAGHGHDHAATGAIETDYVWLVEALPRGLAPTFVETVRLLLATEELGFVCFPAAAHQRATGATRWIVSRELWHADGHFDTRALRRRAKRWPGRVLGKIASDLGDHELLPQALCRPEIRRHIRRGGAYVVPVATKPRIVEHRLALPPPRATPLSGELGARPGVMLLLTAAPASGLERLLAVMLEDLAEDTRPVLVTVAPPTAWSGLRLRALGRLTPAVYSLGGFIAEQLHGDVIRELIVGHDIRRLMHAGGGETWPELAAWLRKQLPDLRVVDLAGGRHAAEHRAVDRHLAAGAASEQALLTQGVAADQILRLRTADFDPATADADVDVAADADADAGARLRDEWQWGADAVLVAMSADFVAEQRPEDFIALAHRFRDDRRFRFLLVGDGPLSADLMDLKRLFGLSNLRLERPRWALAEILEAADIICATTESAVLPLGVLAALRHRRPVVAAAVGDLPRLLAAGPCGITVPYPGDLDGFEAALRALAASDSRRELGERGPKAAHDLYDNDGGARIWRRALDLEPTAKARPDAHGDDG